MRLCFCSKHPVSGRPRRRRITVSLAQVTSRGGGWGGWGGLGAGMRALHSPVPNHSKNKEKYHMGCSDHLKIQRYAPSKAAFNIQRSHYPISRMHYGSMITYFEKLSKGQVKRAAIAHSNQRKWLPQNPPKEQSPTCVLTLMPLTIARSYLTTVFTLKSDRPWEVR